MKAFCWFTLIVNITRDSCKVTVHVVVASSLLLFVVVAESKDWHHGGKQQQLLCTECRLYYDEHGHERPLPVDKGFLFKPVKVCAHISDVTASYVIVLVRDIYAL